MPSQARTRCFFDSKSQSLDPTVFYEKKGDLRGDLLLAVGVNRTELLGLFVAATGRTTTTHDFANLFELFFVNGAVAVGVELLEGFVDIDGGPFGGIALFFGGIALFFVFVVASGTGGTALTGGFEEFFQLLLRDLAIAIGVGSLEGGFLESGGI